MSESTTVMTNTARTPWEAFQSTVDINPPTVEDEEKLKKLREAVSVMKANVVELKTKQKFLTKIRNVSDAQNIAPSEAQIQAKEDAVVAAKAAAGERATQRQQAQASASQALTALTEAHRSASSLNADVRAREEELEALKATFAQLAKGEDDPAAREAESEAERRKIESELLAGISGARVLEWGREQCSVELQGLERPFTLTLKFARSASGQRPVFRSAELSSSEFGDIDISDLVQFGASLNDAAFVVSEARSRCRCAFARAAEVRALQEKYLAFDDKKVVRVTFTSGAIACLATGADYPYGVGGVTIEALETMGPAPLDLAQCKALIAETTTLTQAAEALSKRLSRK